MPEQRAGVSVICPVHDAADHIDDFVERMAATIGPHDEVIVIDDASSDGTADRVAAAIAERSGFVLLRNEQNLGVARSRNRAIEHASRELLWFADHDDRWETDAIDRLVGAIDDETDVVVARADYRTDPAIPGRIVDGFGEPAEMDALGLLRRVLDGRVHGYLWTKLIRKHLLLTHPFPALSSQSDFVGFVSAIPDVRRARTIDVVLYHYVNRPGSITRRKRVAFENFRVALQQTQASAATLGMPADDPDLLFFDAWFYRHALVFVPVRQRADAETFRDGMRLARAGAGSIPVRALWRRRPRTGMEMLMIRRAPWAYRPSISAALTVHDWMRAVRNARGGR